MAKTVEKEITMNQLEFTELKVTIAGDGDLTLNKMNDVVAKQLTDKRKGKAKEIKEPNMWEEIITSMHWLKPVIDFSEEGMCNALNPANGNAPCIKGFAFKKSFCDAVVRYEIDKYKTKFDASVNIVDNLIPVKFVSHAVDEMLMSPQKGAPVLVRINRFIGWEATFTVKIVNGTSYTPESVLNIINLAGFGLGIGSGRSSGFGRYHIVNVEAV